MSLTADDLASRHTIPMIDPIVDILGEVERYEAGVSIGELTKTLSLPRTTIYRILIRKDREWECRSFLSRRSGMTRGGRGFFRLTER